MALQALGRAISVMGGTMEPTAIYNKSKRNLAVFAGLLALVLFGGIEPKEKEAISLLPFHITRPDAVPHVIFPIVAYCAYQYYLSWTYQSEQIQKKTRIDFYFILSLSIGAICYYIFVHWLPSITEDRQVFITLVAIITTSISAVSVFFLFGRVKALRDRLFAVRRETIADRIVESGWILNFNPKHPKGRKAISFKPEGEIGTGRNQNEHTWKIANGHLEIWKENGDLQNRFLYDEENDRFVSTNEPEADAIKRGIRDQEIYREAD